MTFDVGVNQLESAFESLLGVMAVVGVGTGVTVLVGGTALGEPGTIAGTTVTGAGSRSARIVSSHVGDASVGVASAVTCAGLADSDVGATSAGDVKYNQHSANPNAMKHRARRGTDFDTERPRFDQGRCMVLQPVLACGFRLRMCSG